VDQLPYESAEGGYQGWHTSTYELLVEEVAIELPRDRDDSLLQTLIDEIGEDAWCEYDWLALEPDESMVSSWDTFCRVVKHDRRFFFHNFGDTGSSHPDERSPAQFLMELVGHVVDQNLVRTEPIGYRLFRARVRNGSEGHFSAAELGPPPPTLATQSNRMNPPGISMFYGADEAGLAVVETRAHAVSLGTFEVTRPIRVLDLANLPAVPGIFSTEERDFIFSLSFLRRFADLVSQPVPRNDRTQIDYIPTQVFTEFLRDFEFSDGRIDGIRYRSATGHLGHNLVLFAEPEDVIGATPEPEYGRITAPWLLLVGVEQWATEGADPGMTNVAAPKAVVRGRSGNLETRPWLYQAASAANPILPVERPPGRMGKLSADLPDRLNADLAGPTMAEISG
jgi:hypothetical protein